MTAGFSFFFFFFLMSSFESVCLQTPENCSVTIYLEGLVDMAASDWLTSMVENNP